MPARERKPDQRSPQPPDGNSNRRRNVTDERRAFTPGPPEPSRPNQSPEPPGANGPSQTFALSSRIRTDSIDGDYPPSSNDNPRATARLIIERGGRVGREFTITGIETNIGRWDADSGIFPDVDLDEDDPDTELLDEIVYEVGECEDWLSSESSAPAPVCASAPLAAKLFGRDSDTAAWIRLLFAGVVAKI